MFPSEHAPKIWESLFDVSIPDQLTLDPSYIKRFGVRMTGDKEADKILSRNFIHVKITISTILEYYDKGIEVRIHEREDMIRIHKNIELYLSEWKQHLKYDINLQVSEHKPLILALEKLSKDLYNKAKPVEVVSQLVNKSNFGLVNPLAAVIDKKKTHTKPDYEGIRGLVSSRSPKPVGRF